MKLKRAIASTRTLIPRTSALHAALRAALFALSVLLAAAPVGAAQFSVTNLATFSSQSSPRSINNVGQVVGHAILTSNYANINAFLWQSGSMQDLGSLGGRDSLATAINDAGQVVGWAGTENYGSHAFLWQSGSMQDLGTLGGTYSVAFDINAAGQVVGAANTSGYAPNHAFLWQSGSMQDLGTLGGTDSAALGINAAGQVVGQAFTSGDATYHAFLWQSGNMQDLGTLGGKSSTALDINDTGQVVGGAGTQNYGSHAFLWQSGNMQDLGTLGGTSVARGINAAGQVVGYSYTDVAQHAFLWQSGSMTDLNSLIDPLSGWTITDAFDINDLGQIVASGCSTGGCTAVLLTPVPEPETYLMMLAGLGLLAAKARRRNSAQ